MDLHRFSWIFIRSDTFDHLERQWSNVSDFIAISSHLAEATRRVTSNGQCHKWLLINQRVITNANARFLRNVLNKTPIFETYPDTEREAPRICENVLQYVKVCGNRWAVVERIRRLTEV